MQDRDPLTEKIIACCLKVHSELWPGFNEKIYHNSLKLVLTAARLDYQAEKEFAVYFQDKKVGIPEEYHEKIFDKFERMAAEKEEGTGLGLPIAKDIIELHKGRIWVESQPGEGAKFIFVLPRDLRK